MSESSAYCCWVKITPKGELQLPQPGSGAGITDEGGRAARITELMHQLSVAMLLPVNILEPNVPPRLAGFKPTAWWTLDGIYGGVTGEVVDIAPVVGGREEAEAWLTGDAGRDWLKGSRTYFLLHFRVAD
jgi:hypothetical protein